MPPLGVELKLLCILRRNVEALKKGASKYACEWTIDRRERFDNAVEYKIKRKPITVSQAGRIKAELLKLDKLLSYVMCVADTQFVANEEGGNAWVSCIPVLRCLTIAVGIDVFLATVQSF